MQYKCKLNFSSVIKPQVNTSYLTDILKSLYVINHSNIFMVLKKKKSPIVYKDNELSQLTWFLLEKMGAHSSRQNMY